jgi:3-oxoacyl-[acyl-carrier-protein] synthase-3
MHAHIRAIEYYLPPKVFSNRDYFELFPELESNKNLMKIGIEERRIVGEGVTASDMAVEAAEQLFASSGIDKSEVDYILFCAQEFDHYTPTTACLIQERLGLPVQCGAIDYNLGCSGFVYGVQLAKGLIEATGVKNVLLLTSSCLTRTFNEKDRSSRFLFGDGACATLIGSRADDWGINQFVFGTDGSGGGRIIVKDGGARNPIQDNSFEDELDEYGNTTSRGQFYMNGTAVFVFGMRTVPKMIAELIEKTGIAFDDIDVFVFHQANEFMMETIRKKVGIPEEKFIVSMSHCGNTVSSSIPIALHEAMKQGRAKAGDKVLLAAFGVGLSWAGTIIQL